MYDNLTLSNIVKKRLNRLSVQLIYLFGSHAEGASHPMSDVDIGVVLDYRVVDEDSSARYNELFDIFTDIFPNESIDIVFLQRAGLELCFDVICHGKVLFESNPDIRDAFEHRTQMLYMDFKPILKEYDEQMLAWVK